MSSLLLGSGVRFSHLHWGARLFDSMDKEGVVVGYNVAIKYNSRGELLFW